MLVSSGFDELKEAQMAIANLNKTKPSIFQGFLNIIHLTRQMQFGYQYMGALLMDEDPSEFLPNVQDDYVLSIYHHEIDKLKADQRFPELKQLLSTYKPLSYANISKLALGDNPKELTGPTVIH
ncbi:hypothetical protein HPT25_07560 [Bacillus sp. BRMEA1]|uniref:hypothetical protein n=1 Tax=Neobacillus endophyticus TaxID=2738405 RepID=UPI001563FC29|nr:hypothetical protein [Neobacillus endophyticus]NRD77355.1 hypothetical protein [Neobacillus endophyticus]